MSDSTSSGTLHPMAPEHMPYFIPTVDGQDGMMTTAIFFIVIGAMLGGTFYLHLHSIPERLAHGTNRTQLQLVAILALIALFTHQTIFWIAALLLAAAQFPDFLTPITSSARSLATMANREYEGDQDEETDDHKVHQLDAEADAIRQREA